MATVSYGTITVTDLTDITDVFLQYGLALSNATVTNSYSFNETGEIGWFTLTEDTSVNNNKIYFRLDSGVYKMVINPTGNPYTQGWYESSPYPTWTLGYQIWIRQVQIKEGIEEPEYGTPYLDTAVNQINLSIGDINTELQTRLKHFWDNLTSHTHGNNWTKPDYPAGTYTASGIENITFDEEDSDTYGYNTHYANGIKLRYNAINLTTLLHSGLSLYYPIVDNNNIITNSSIGAIFSTNALSFFQPPTISNNTITQGNKTMMLSSNALTFYNPNDGITAYATLDINGLKLVKGGIEAGTAGQSGFIYLSTDPYGSYTIHDSTQNDWKQIVGTNFGIRSDGSMYATNVNIVGIISAAEGTIGGFTIRSGELYSLSHNEPYSNESGIYIGTSIMTFGPNGTIWFDDSGKGKVGSWNFNLDELSMISNDTIQSIILSKQGVEIKDTSYPNNYFKISFIDGGGYLSISLSDKILVQEDQLTVNANSISINNNQNTYDVLEWITNNHAIAINNQSIINTTLIPFITTYSQYISINTSTPYIYIGTNNFNTDIEIRNSQIDFNITNNNMIHLTSEWAQINNTQVENLRMKAQNYTNNSGYLTWIARSNGHLSLKVVK